MPEKLVLGTDGQAIQHFGVKGMRWGVRKKRGRPTNASKERTKERRKYLNDRYAMQQINEESSKAALAVGVVVAAGSRLSGSNGWDAAKDGIGAAMAAKVLSGVINAVQVDAIRYSEKKAIKKEKEKAKKKSGG